MRIGVGLPNTIPGATGDQLITWARRADELGFSTLATIGRVAYPGYDELVALSAAAAVTKRIGLFTNVLLGPTRDPVLLAKEAASLDRISNGRLVLGLAVGFRPDDYAASGTDYRSRGARLDRAIETMRAAWRGEPVAGAGKPVAPTPVDGAVPLAFGGPSDPAIDRAARFGVGWTAGGGSPEDAEAAFGRVREAFARHGRTESPRLWALAYYALGDRALDLATGYLSDYYGEWGGPMAAGIPKDADAIVATVDAFAAAGTDELILDPVSADLDQLEMLGEALGERLRVAVGAA
jgi:alkanesulfonate monooxygenase SsuD/methylene tetrahydromethanopterin reductase-like flavin-dependent oxidoreductase (luciferase family)